MTLYLSPPHSIVTIFYLLLCQLSLAAALPARNDLTARANKPDLSGATGKIAGAALGLIVISLGFGLGSATIAVLGSVEWREFRDRKKTDEEKALSKVATEESQSTTGTEEKQSGRDAQARLPRLNKLNLKSFNLDSLKSFHLNWDSLKLKFNKLKLQMGSFRPVDFRELKSVWLSGNNKK